MLWISGDMLVFGADESLYDGDECLTSVYEFATGVGESLWLVMMRAYS